MVLDALRGDAQTGGVCELDRRALATAERWYTIAELPRQEAHARVELDHIRSGDG